MTLTVDEVVLLVASLKLLRDLCDEMPGDEDEALLAKLEGYLNSLEAYS